MWDEIPTAFPGEGKPIV